MCVTTCMMHGCMIYLSGHRKLYVYTHPKFIKGVHMCLCHCASMAHFVYMYTRTSTQYPSHAHLPTKQRDKLHLEKSLLSFVSTVCVCWKFMIENVFQSWTMQSKFVLRYCRKHGHMLFSNWYTFSGWNDYFVTRITHILTSKLLLLIRSIEHTL